MADAVLEVPAGALEMARSTLGGAVTAAAQLPAEQGAALLAAANEAFAAALRLTAAISTVLSLLTAAIVFGVLREVRR
jgi:DHA2 family multidrug resistance protein-like MFS transporter